MPETDGVDEAIEGTLRVALTAAARIGEQIARQREVDRRRAEADSVDAARNYQARLEAEKAAARAARLPVRRDEWWERASVDDIANAYQTARSWSAVDPDAAAVEDLILQRTGQDRPVDPVDAAPAPSPPSRLDQAVAWAREHDPEWLAGNRLSHDNADTSDGQRFLDDVLIGRWEAAVAGDETRKQQSDAATRETVTAVAAADRADRAVVYDSRERRSEFAAELEAIGDATTVEARIRADISQGAPATEATGSVDGNTPQARKSHGQATIQRQRGLVR